MSAGPTLRIGDSQHSRGSREGKKDLVFCGSAVSQLASAVAVTFRRFGGDKLDRVAARAPETETTRKLKVPQGFQQCCLVKSLNQLFSLSVFVVHICNASRYLVNR